MYPAVWERVVSGRYSRSPGCIVGYRRVRIRSKSHPALIVGDQQIQGVVWFQVSPADVEILDNFEGIHYRRAQISANLPNGGTLGCQVFLWRQEFRRLLLEEDWDLKVFETEGIIQFQRDYEGFKEMG